MVNAVSLIIVNQFISVSYSMDDIVGCIINFGEYSIAFDLYI